MSLRKFLAVGAPNQYDTAFADNLSLMIAADVVTFPTVPVTVHRR